MGAIKEKLILSSASIVVLIFCIMILELIFGYWIRVPKGWALAERLNIIRDQEVSYSTSTLYESSRGLSLYSRDKNGLRGSCHEPERIDIVTMGGSTTDQRYISDGLTWQDILQYELRTKTRDNSICVTNAGVDGHSTFGHLASLKYWFPLISKFRPRYYLLYIGINDAAFRNGPSDQVETLENSSWRAKSIFYQKIRLLARAIEKYTEKNQNKYSWHNGIKINERKYDEKNSTVGTSILLDQNSRQFEINLKSLLSSIRESGGVPVCVSQPHRLAKRFGESRVGVKNAFEFLGKQYNGIDYDISLMRINGILESLCLKEKGFFIDAYNSNFEDDDFYDYVHMTPKGAMKLGKIISSSMLSFYPN
jgi:lysophospholipase L1-like esterase